ncbi:MAG TPA: hypothetical protein VES79_03405 [Solirubrobacteraceae bacterium]|nr:hypothetical protein [Solirubrobacteraceae bacterium]
MSAPRHRGDIIFALPALPRTAAVLGDPPGWRQDLEERGIELADLAARPDVVVADADRAALAARSGADSVVVEEGGSAVAELRRAGYHVQRLLSMPTRGTPGLLLNLEHPRGLRYGIARRGPRGGRWKVVRDRLAPRVLPLGPVSARLPVVAVGCRHSGPAALLAAAAQVGVRPAEEHWAMIVTGGTAVRRNAFLLLPPGRREPDRVLKFARLPDHTGPFDREERGYELALAAGRTVVSRCPRPLGRIELDSYHAALEEAATGTELTRLLRFPISRKEKLRAVEPVAKWLHDVARETASSFEAFGPERERLRRVGCPPELVDALPPVPGVFRHNDLGEENVVVDDGSFKVVDWEWAQCDSLPLADLVFFAQRILRIIDGADTDDQREPHFVDLMLGRAPGSEIAFRWIREEVEVLGIPPEAVGTLVSLSLHERGARGTEKRRDAERLTGATIAPSFPERTLAAWLSEPSLGPDWDRWRA